VDIQRRWVYLEGIFGASLNLPGTIPADPQAFIATQALHTTLGGWPSGPAGTGKTETVKALGAQLGRFVLVFCLRRGLRFQVDGPYLRWPLPGRRVGLLRRV
jgi:hypothetical protein